MQETDKSVPRLSQLIECRLELLRNLGESLEVSSGALVRNDAEGIARGAAHQAELCRQWSCLEDELRQAKSEAKTKASISTAGTKPSEREHSAELQAEWEAIGTRIRYLTRVHWSLLRHLQRSLTILNRVVNSCAPTYAPDARSLRAENYLRAGE